MRKPSLASWCLIVAVVLTASSAVAQGRRGRGAPPPPPRTFYVAPTGDDASSGSLGFAFRTIQKGADALRPTDTLIIAGGTYKEHVALTKSGRYLGGTITIKAAPGEEVIVDGTGRDLIENSVFTTNNQDYLHISGIHVRNSSGRGIGVANSWQVVLEDCSTSNTVQSGIHVDKSGTVRIARCEVQKACTSAGEESISVKRSQDVEIRDCHVHHTGHEGIDIKEGAKHVRVVGCRVHDVERQGLYAEAWDSPTSDIRFENNVVYNCRFGIVAGSECGGLLSDVWFVGNVVYNCPGGPGMDLVDFGNRQYKHPMRDIYFINNTVYKTGKDGWGGGMEFRNVEAENVVVVNNILFQNAGGPISIFQGRKPVSMTVRGNLMDTEVEGFSEGNLVGDPKFVNAEGADFRLQKGSPAIQAGKAYEKPDEKVDLGALPYEP